MEEQRPWLLEMEPAPGEDAVNTVEMTTKHFGCHIHSAEEAAQGLSGLTPRIKEVLWSVKCLKTAPHTTEKFLWERSQSVWQTQVLF